MNTLFERLKIIGSDNNLYMGVRPSLIPKPFKSVKVVCLNGKEISPTPFFAKGKELIAGFDVSIKVITNILDMQGKPSYFFRLITVYKDGSKWSELYSLDGNLLETEWI